MSQNSQWNLVTKSKKQKNLEKKVEARQEQKRLAAQLPKLEEILPSYQYQSLVTGKSEKPTPPKAKTNGGSANKSKSPNKKSKEKSLKEDGTKKQIQQPKSKAPPKPKSLEIALRDITQDDFLANLEQLKLQFPGSELLWLKGIAAYLNSSLPFDSDSTFSGKPTQYPSSLASPKLKETLLDFLKSVGEVNLTYFYHNLLTSMTSELNNNLPIVGYKFLLQVIGLNWPQICADNLAQTALLRNSYQNRPNICLSIFWAIGQGGFQNLMTGIKVWQNLMLPNLEMKHYSKYVSEYIEKILNVAVDQQVSLIQNEFFAIYKALMAPRPSLPKEQQLSLQRSSELFLQHYIACSSKHANIFLSLFREIENPNKSKIELDGCLSCLLRSSGDTYKVWKMNYKKQLLPSTLLLNKIDDEWDSSAYILAKSDAFYNFLSEAALLNEELEMVKKRDPLLDDLIVALRNVQEKTAAQKKKQKAEEKKSCGCCLWVLGSFLIIGLIAGVITYDYQVNGKGVFEKSATGKALKDLGLLPHAEKAWYTTMGASARGYKWAEKNVPPYAAPVIKLSCDLFKLAKNALCNALCVTKDVISSKVPIAVQFLDQYVPGLPQKIENTSVTVKNVVVDLFGKTVSFFKTQVLVGRLSPENLGKALNDTQNVALEYYKIFHKKVDTYAKLK